MGRKKKFRLRRLLPLMVIAAIAVNGCNDEVRDGISKAAGDIATRALKQAASQTIENISGSVSRNADNAEKSSQNEGLTNIQCDEPYRVLNGNIPYFTEAELARGNEVFEEYSELDDLGRCGVAFANICKDIMPTEKRGEIGMVKPSGWKQAKYPELIEGAGYIYNRCHLIAFELAGENANDLNLITGTRAFNLNMLIFENQVADYVRKTGNHVLYRVTPDFKGSELVARGVTIEARSVEDDGCVFCVYCPNVQPGITINYENGNTEKFN